MGMRGSSDLLPVADLIQATASGGGTGRILLEGPAGRGEVYFEAGQVVHAVYADLVGPEAVYALAAATGLQFEVESGASAPARTIDASVPALLLEGARLQDEGRLRQPTFQPPPPMTVAEGRIAMSAAEGAQRLPERRRFAGSRWLLLTIAIVVVGWGATVLGRRVGLTLDGAAARSPAAENAGAEAAVVYEATELVGEGDRPPMVTYGPPVRAPRAMSVMPTVIVRGLVHRNGGLSDATVYGERSEWRELEALAIEAVAHYRFEPARKSGASVAAWVNVPVAFEWDDRGVEAIRIKGSNTLGAELGRALAQTYERHRHSALVTVEALGSSTGFSALMDGTAEIGASSRGASDREIAKADSLGIRLREFVVGYDAIAIVVPWSNPIESLSLAQVADLYRGEALRWSDVGGQDVPVTLVTRPPYSGTYELLRERLADAHGDSGLVFSAAAEVVESSDAVVERVLMESGAIGYVSTGCVDDRVKALAIDGVADAPVAPSAETIRLGTYPLHRPLRFYARDRMTHETVAFLRFVLGPLGQERVAEFGFVANEVSPASTMPSYEDVVEAVPAARITRIHFDWGHNRLNAAAKKVLAQLAASVRNQDRLLVVGHSDAGGTVSDNARAAHARATTVAKELQSHGIDSDRLETRSEAADRPLATNMTPEGRRENRRVDIFVLAGG